MDSTTMVIPQLPPEWVEAGELFIRNIDKAGVPITSVFWRFEEGRGWRLTLVSPEVDQIGKRASFLKVRDSLYALPSPGLRSSYVTAMRADDPIAAAVRRMVPNAPGITRVRLTGNVSNGILIPDALVYRA